MAAACADAREPHRPTQQRSKCQAGAEYLPSALAMRTVENQPFVQPITASSAHALHLGSHTSMHDLVIRGLIYINARNRRGA